MHTRARWFRCMGGKDFSGYDGRPLPPICLFVYMILTTKNKNRKDNKRRNKIEKNKINID